LGIPEDSNFPLFGSVGFTLTLSLKWGCDNVNQPEQIVGSQDRVEFHGFESLYQQILDIEDQLLYSNIQTEAAEAFDDLKNRLKSSRPRSEQSSSKPDAKKPKPAPDDNS
jgi:hypothetical protein